MAAQYRLGEGRSIADLRACIAIHGLTAVQNNPSPVAYLHVRWMAMLQYLRQPQIAWLGDWAGTDSAAEGQLRT